MFLPLMKKALIGADVKTSLSLAIISYSAQNRLYLYPPSPSCVLYPRCRNLFKGVDFFEGTILPCTYLWNRTQIDLSQKVHILESGMGTFKRSRVILCIRSNYSSINCNCNNLINLILSFDIFPLV